MWLMDGFSVTVFGRWRELCAHMLLVTHVWREHSHVGVTHVWRGHSRVGVTHVSRGHSRVGVTHVWELLTCVKRATKVKFFTP